MLRFTAALSAALAAAVLLTGFQAAPPQLTPQLAALAENVEAARAFDYMALKADGADLKALSDAVYFRARAQGGENRRCLTEAELNVQMGLAAALVATNDDLFAADRRAAEAAWARWLAFGERMMSGATVTEPPFSHVADRVATAEAASDPRVRDLLRRAARDQLIRRGWEVGSEVWEEPPTPGARGRFESRLSRRMCETDGDNTAWLKADIAANGWYRISTFGRPASNAAWLMIQHADRDTAFQQDMLTVLEPLVAEKEIEPFDYALLFDRVAVNAGRPQRYGSQGRCVARNVWGPQPLEDEARVDEFRASVELPPLVDYAAHMSRWCADFTG